MRIHTRIEHIWDGQKYVEVYEEGFDCPENGQIALCKGASDDQKELNDNQKKFYSTLSDNYNQQFANQSNILQSLNNVLAPVVAAGPSQYGYSKDQTNALNSEALQGTAQQYQNAQKSLQNQQAARGGGTMYLPSGVDAQNNAALASSGANQISSQLLNIKNAGYQQGNQNYNNAVSAMGGVANTYNPLGYSGSVTGAGSAAANEANVIQQANAAASPWGAIGGLLGGVAGSFAGPLGASLGSKLSGSLGGMKGGGGGNVASLTGNAGSVG